MSNTDTLNSLVSELKQIFVSRGYYNKKNSYYKEAECGLHHVIEFGLGQAWSIYHGKFTVDIGIYIKEWHDLFFSYAPTPKRPSIAYCEITKRLPSLIPGIDDKWWDLLGSKKLILKEITGLMEQYGFPFLDELETRAAIIASWHRYEYSIGFSPRGRLAVAILCVSINDIKKARELIQEEYASSSITGYRLFIKEISNKLGIDENGA